MIDGLRVCLVGPEKGVWLWTSEIMLIKGGVERVSGDIADLQDLECDVAIINCPEQMLGWKIPKARVNLFLAIEAATQYRAGYLMGHRYDFNQFAKHWDGSISCNSGIEFWRDQMPAFYFDAMCRWPDYAGILQEFKYPAAMFGARMTYRDMMVRRCRQRIRHVGGMPDEALPFIRESGIGVNIHGHDGAPKTEHARLSLYANLGCAIVSEPLDPYLPERFRGVIAETRDVPNFMSNHPLSGYRHLAERVSAVLMSHHDMIEEVWRLVRNIRGQFNL